MEQQKESGEQKSKNQKGAADASSAQEPKNSLKRARQFDFEMLFAQTVQTKQNEQEATDFSRISLRNEKVDDKFQAERQARTSGSSSLSSGRNNSDDEEVGPAIPEHLKAKNLAADDREEENEEEGEGVGPAIPAGFVPDRSVQVDEDDAGFDEGEITVSSVIPAAYEVTIKTDSTKAITALSFDMQGTKFATGSYSYSINMYEFQRMDSAMNAFRQIYPCESHVINDIAFNNNGEMLLVGSSTPVLKLLDRQGSQFTETVRGDQYLVDLANTKGHTAAICAVCWHPFNKGEFLTCGEDGTLRIWDTADHKVITKCINTQRKVIKTKNATGKRALATTCCYSRDGKLIAAGCDDGSIQIWKNAKLFVNTAYLCRNAHNGPITRLEFSPDNQRIISRSLDDTLKLWSLAAFKQPLKVADGLPTVYPQTDCGYSPHAEFIYTATNDKSREGGQTGSLLFFDSESLELLYKIEFEKQGCIRAIWHPKINQILVGLSDGTCKIYYDPSISLRGALQCVTRQIKRTRESEIVREELILSPLTLEMFQPKGEDGEEREVTEWRLRKFLRMQSKQKRPQFRQPAAMPMSGPSTGGRIRAQGGTLHSYVAKEMGLVRNKEFIDDEDIRAAILRHAEEAEKDPLYITKAYTKTQPKPIFQETTEEETEESEEPVYKVPKLGF